MLELREQRELKHFQAQLDKLDLLILDELGSERLTGVERQLEFPGNDN